MPRSNRTFHGGDIIRLLAKNLANSEQDDVLLFLYMIVPEIAVDRIEARLVGSTSTLPGGRFSFTVIRLFLYIRGWFRFISMSLRQLIVRNLMSSEAQKEVTRAIELLGGGRLRFTIRR